MTHADAFLQDILAHPDDDAPRLIFADWLEEQGDANSTARAEFIRIQCALAASHLPEQQRAELVRREKQILHEYSGEWGQPIRRLVQTWKFHRGFIDEVEMPADRFLACADRLFHVVPIQHLRFTYSQDFSIDKRTSMAALADSEHLHHLRSLDFSCNGLNSQDVCALMVSPYLTGLTSLSLASNRIGASGIRALAGAPLLGQLEHLNLCGNDIGTGGLRALVQALKELDGSSEGLRLRRLELSGNNLSDASRRFLAESPLLRRLMAF